MIQKYSVLIGVLISVAFIFAATFVYPGGSILNENSIGFNWTENFFSNLFAEKAINGSENPSRYLAFIGMAFHSVSYGLFYLNSAKKLPSKHASKVLKFTGITNIVFSFLIVTPLHDAMVTISSTLTLLGLFYLTVFILKTRLHILKFSCIICLMIFYYTLFLYGSGNWGMLAIMQKVSAVCSMALVLGIEYFTKPKDFEIATSGQQNIT